MTVQTVVRLLPWRRRTDGRSLTSLRDRWRGRRCRWRRRRCDRRQKRSLLQRPEDQDWSPAPPSSPSLYEEPLFWQRRRGRWKGVTSDKHFNRFKMADDHTLPPGADGQRLQPVTGQEGHLTTSWHHLISCTPIGQRQGRLKYRD